MSPSDRQYTPIPAPKRLKQEDHKFDSPRCILRLPQKYTKVEAGETVQSIEGWPYKHEDPSSLYLEVSFCDPSTGEMEKGGSQDSLTALLVLLCPLP